MFNKKDHDEADKRQSENTKAPNLKEGDEHAKRSSSETDSPDQDRARGSQSDGKPRKGDGKYAR